jgi:diguanylate cyclase (GGDEF)-like protein
LTALIGGALAVAVLAQRLLAESPVPALPVTLVLVLLLAGGISSIISRHLAGSLGELRDGMQSLAEGELDPQVASSRVSELHDMSLAFNSMASALRESTEQLEHQAFHDPLTGLPNRALFMSSFSTALTWSTQNGRAVAVLFMDVDRFKYLNDSLGHGVGDQLLAVLSRRLVAASSGHLVARLGGDEFTMLVSGANADGVAIEIAERVMLALQRPFSVAGHELFVSMSIGLAVSTPNDQTITELLRKADIALYRAKADGRGRCVAFHDELDALSIEQFDLDNALRRAVGRGELLLHYQPIMDLPSGEIVGMEALVRWNHPHRGILSPATFIAMAEETGEIVRIGQWVLEEACRQTVAFEALNRGKPLTVSVNITASEFRQPGLAARVAQVLDDTGLTPRSLKLELTESALIGDVPETIAILSELRGLGVGLSIDDFGTGYSSLSYLQRLPVDTLKVDQSFVASLGETATAGPVLRAIVELGNALFMQVIAEGIETRAQVEFLASIGCQYGQGHYFHRAMPAEEFEDLLREPPVSFGRGQRYLRPAV